MMLIEIRQIAKETLTGFLYRLSFSFLSIVLMFNPFLGIHSVAHVQKSPPSDSKTKEKTLSQLIKSNRIVLSTFANEYLKLRKEPLSTRLTHLKQIALPLVEAAEKLGTFLHDNPNANNDEANRQLETLLAYAEFANESMDERSIFLGEEVTNRARILEKEPPPPVFGINGRIVVLSVLSADGKVKHTIVAQSLKKDLDEQAIQTARRIKFIPATKDGHSVSQLVEIEYEYISD